MRKWLVVGMLTAGLWANNSILAAQTPVANASPIATSSNATTASLLRPAIQLNSIKPLKKTEKGSNEIYVGMGEFNSNGKNRYYTIPQSPVYWPQQSVTQISNFQLWQGKLSAGNASEVIISFIEQDTSPWNLDDLITVVKIKMMNDNGKLRYEWYQNGKFISNQKSQVAVLLRGSEGDYIATLSLVMRDSTKAERSPDRAIDKK